MDIISKVDATVDASHKNYQAVQHFCVRNSSKMVWKWTDESDKGDSRKLQEGSVCGYAVLPERMSCIWPIILVNIFCVLNCQKHWRRWLDGKNRWM